MAAAPLVWLLRGITKKYQTFPSIGKISDSPEAAPTAATRADRMTRRNWTITALAVLVAVVLFGGGVIFGQKLMFKSFSVELRGVQAKFLFDRIVQERVIKSLLSRGCITEASGDISNNELADRETLSRFVNEKLDSDTIAYINKRDANILNELGSPMGSLTNTWPGCQK